MTGRLIFPDKDDRGSEGTFVLSCSPGKVLEVHENGQCIISLPILQVDEVSVHGLLQLVTLANRAALDPQGG